MQVRTLRVKLPSGVVRQMEPDWAGKLSDFILLFEALILVLAREIPLAAMARLIGEIWHRVAAICQRYVCVALAQAYSSGITRLAIDETSRARGHDYVTLAVDAAPERRAVLFLIEGSDAGTISRLAEDLVAHGANIDAIESVSIDMSPAFVKGWNMQLPGARITFDKFHVIAHAPKALDEALRLEQKTTPDLKGLRWTMLRDYVGLNGTALTEIDALLSKLTTKSTARA